MEILEKTHPDFWKNQVKIGDILYLTDIESLKYEMNKGGGIEGLECQVKNIRIIDTQYDFQYYIYELDKGCVLLAKIVGDDMDLRVYWPIEDEYFQPGNRQDQINNESYWLFEEPEDPENFSLNELNFTYEFIRSIKTNQGEVDCKFVRKEPGEIYGKCFDKNDKNDKNKKLSIIIEYHSSEHNRSEGLILEVCGFTEDNKEGLNGEGIGDEGGLITLYLGNNINFEEISLL